MKKTRILLFVLPLSVTLLTGCGDKAEDSAGGGAAGGTPAPAPAPPAIPDMPGPATANTAPPPPPGSTVPIAPVGEQPEPPEDAKIPDKEKILGAIQSYVIQNESNPTSLEQLVQKGYLRKVPPAPEGKKWALDEKLMPVLVNK